MLLKNRTLRKKFLAKGKTMLNKFAAVSKLKFYSRRYKNLILSLPEHYPKRLNKPFRHELYRKLIHLSSLWIPALIYLARPGIAIALFSVLLAGDALIEYGNYKKWRWARRTFGHLFYKTLRNKERVRTHFQVTGSMYVLTAAIVCTMLFSKEVAVVALSIMLISDTCAALFGRAYGLRKLYKNKSLEGTTAFFVSALGVMIILNPLYPVTYAGIIAAAAATLAEIYEDKIEIDDNLSIPLFVGIILSILN